MTYFIEKAKPVEKLLSEQVELLFLRYMVVLYSDDGLTTICTVLKGFAKKGRWRFKNINYGVAAAE